MFPMVLRAVLFDMDGTLAETEGVGFDIARALFLERGVSLDDEDHRSFRGRAEDEFFAAASRRYGLGDPEGLRGAYTARYLPTLEAVEPLPGAVEAVREALGRVAVAIVSGSTADQIGRVLRALGLHELVRWRFGCGDYGEGKPSPQPYLVAARAVGVDPSRCLVVEDSDPGVASALAAGMRCVLVRGPGSPVPAGVRADPGADVVLRSLEEFDVDDLARRLFR